jgi:hypothetical protein
VRVERLPMQVALVDDVVVDEGDVLDPASSEQSEQRGPEPAGPDDENARHGAHWKYSPKLK